MNRFKVLFKYVSRSLWMFTCMLMLGGCQKFSPVDLPEDEETCEVKIQARAAQNVALTYPIRVYAFDSQGNSCASQEITSSSESLNLKLSLGTYQVAALAGFSSDYVLPDNPTQHSVVSLSNGHYARVPVLMGTASLTVDNAGKSVPLEVMMAYQVAALDVQLKGIPAEVKGVKVRLSPLFASFAFNGSFQGEGTIAEVVCEKKATGDWCASPYYIFPGSGTETRCDIMLDYGNSTQTYTYIYKGVPLANHPFNLKGNYKGEVVQGGSFVIKGWEEAINVDFEFGSEVDPALPDAGGGTEGGQIDMTGIPKMGTIWNGCIVLGIANATNLGADLLLMSIEEWEGTTAEAAEIPKGYSVNGISDWKYPSDAQAKYIRDQFNGSMLDALNENILLDNPNHWEISRYSDTRYLCTKNGLFYSFQFIPGTSVTKAGDKKVYLIRLVNTYHFKK